MKLTKKNIGQLFDVKGSDGSWVYLLVDIKGKELLFYDMAGEYWALKTHSDWRRFKPSVSFRETECGWKMAKRERVGI